MGRDHTGRTRRSIADEPDGPPDGEDRIVVHVRDNGPGVFEAIIDNVFDPFFSTRRCDGGTGLGSSLVHRFVENLGGAVRVENQPSGGAHFVVELPLRKE